MTSCKSFKALRVLGFVFLAAQQATSFSTMSSEEADKNILKQFWKDGYGGNVFRENDYLDSSLLTRQLLGKAEPDECFIGVGKENLYPFDSKGTENCPAPGRLKINEAYVFGLTEASNGVLWFGSAPNMGCLVFGTIADSSPLELTPYQGDTWACEYGNSRFGAAAGLPDRLGDWRPPSIYTYNPQIGKVEKKPINDPLLVKTLGLRAAGALGDVVFLGGPQATGVGGALETAGINLFAFHAQTGKYLGSKQFLEYNNIRKFVSVGGALYTGVMVNKSEFPSGTSFGAVLRWTGTVESPFSFEVVGWMDGEGAELVEHDGRIFVSTWPDFSNVADPDAVYDYAGLWMSPVLSDGGLTVADADSWQKVWSAPDYEPDEVAARMYNGGALASYEGYLYWGSLHAPLSAGFAHAIFHNHLDPVIFGIPNVPAIIAALYGSHRPINIFRGRDFGTASEEKEVLYGLNRMPAYIDGRWKIVRNKMGKSRFGISGFGNAFNTYTWTMAVHKDALYVGTMDWSHTLTNVMIPVLAQSVINPFPEFELPRTKHGADLYVFPASDKAAIRLDEAGLGNYGSYGVRTMVASADNMNFYLGMANAMNLMTDLNDDKPEGGWELIRIDTCIPECVLECQGFFSCLLKRFLEWISDLWNNIWNRP